MNSARFALLCSLLVMACGEGAWERKEEKTSQADAAAEEAEPVPDVAPSPSPKSSVMRPSVAAEARPPMRPPAQPISAAVYFTDGSVALSKEARSMLDALIERGGLAGGREIRIRGHSDSRGDDSDNLLVSARRAEAVSNYLAQKGIEQGRMAVFALGEGRPIAPNVNLDGSDNPEGRAKNRRVDIEVTARARESADRREHQMEGTHRG